MAIQQYSSYALRLLWHRYQGQGSEYTGIREPGTWEDPRFFGQPIGGVPSVAVGAYAALELALTTSGYGPPAEGRSVWAYNYRPIKGTNLLSLHSYGIAIDIDPTENPQSWGDPFSGWIQPRNVDAVMEIKVLSGRRAWAWGGYWTPPDRMHFQLDTGPNDVTIDWSTVPGWEEPDMPLSDDDVNRIAEAVWSHEIDTVSGDGEPAKPAKFWLHRGYLIVRHKLGGTSGGPPPAEPMLHRIDKNTRKK